MSGRVAESRIAGPGFASYSADTSDMRLTSIALLVVRAVRVCGIKEPHADVEEGHDTGLGSDSAY